MTVFVPFGIYCHSFCLPLYRQVSFYARRFNAKMKLFHNPLILVRFNGVTVWYKIEVHSVPLLSDTLETDLGGHLPICSCDVGSLSQYSWPRKSTCNVTSSGLAATSKTVSIPVKQESQSQALTPVKVNSNAVTRTPTLKSPIILFNM